MRARLRTPAILMLVLTLALIVNGCAPKPQPTERKIHVVVSILPQAYFVERIGGDKVEVTVMVPPGANPATYEPTASQMKKLAQAKIYIRIRVPFEEAWMDKIAAANKNMLIIDSTEGIERIGNNPHVWLSPRLVKIQAENIYRGLAQIDPTNKDFYAQNKKEFLEELDALDQEIAETLAEVKGRKFMVFHPCWTYFARDYGLEQISIEIEGKEPSAAELARLVETAKANNIKVIFIQPQFSPRTAEAIAHQVGGKVVSVDPLARDWMNNLRHVAKTFAQALSEE